MKKKTRRIILIAVTCFILLAAGFTVVYREAIFQGVFIIKNSYIVDIATNCAMNRIDNGENSVFDEEAI